jgi:hypothetical protein
MAVSCGLLEDMFGDGDREVLEFMARFEAECDGGRLPIPSHLGGEERDFDPWQEDYIRGQRAYIRGQRLN